jgi:hypothetical protein
VVRPTAARSAGGQRSAQQPSSVANVIARRFGLVAVAPLRQLVAVSARKWVTQVPLLWWWFIVGWSLQPWRLLSLPVPMNPRFRMPVVLLNPQPPPHHSPLPPWIHLNRARCGGAWAAVVSLLMSCRCASTATRRRWSARFVWRAAGHRGSIGGLQTSVEATDE